jgi:hypothetical protein
LIILLYGNPIRKVKAKILLCFSYADRKSVPIVAVQTPSDPSINRFYAMLLAALGAPLRPRMRTQELEHKSLGLLRAVGTRRISPRRWKNTVRASALRASPLFSPPVTRRRSAGSRSHLRVNSVVFIGATPHALTKILRPGGIHVVRYFP